MVASRRAGGKSLLNRSGFCALICGRADTAVEHLSLPQRIVTQRRFLAIGFLDIVARTAGVSIDRESSNARSKWSQSRCGYDRSRKASRLWTGGGGGEKPVGCWAFVGGQNELEMRMPRPPA